MRRAKLLTLCLAGSLIVANSVQAVDIKKPEVSGLKNVTSAVSNASAALTPSGVRSSISGINTKLSATDANVQLAFGSLVSAFYSKEDATKIKAQLSAINGDKKLSAAEKSAKLTQIMSDCNNTLKETQTELSTKLKTASASEKTAVVDSIVSLAVASYQYLDIANDCKNLSMNIAKDPKLATSLTTEIANLKDTGVILKNNVKSLKNVTTQAIAVAKAGGVEVKLPSNKAGKTSKATLPLGK